MTCVLKLPHQGIVLGCQYMQNHFYCKMTYIYVCIRRTSYRVTRRVFSEPVTSKLHILSPNILAGHLKASEVTWISAMHSIFSHPPAHSGPISFSKVENLKLASGTNKSKQNFYFQQNQLRLTLKNAGDQKFFLEILLSKY